MQIKYVLPLLSLVTVSVATPVPSPGLLAGLPILLEPIVSGLFDVLDIPTDKNSPKCPNYCAGTAYNVSQVGTYVCGDSRLGPRRLPRRLPLGDLVNSYHRFGELCPGQFLAKWYDSAAGSWIYPPQAGFQLTSAGAPIEGTITLPAGFLLDRFGSEYGTYTSPQGAPYMQRALPPSNLDTPQSTPVYPYNYHVYKVLVPFEVLAGPIAGWFEQPGQGVQYQMSSNIMTLLANGFIESVNIS